MATPKIHIGSISSGSLKTEDLIQAFVDELTYYSPARAASLIQEYEPSDPEELDYESEEASFYLEALTEALEDLAPVGLYFGSAEGDGADFGFWPLNEYDLEGVETVSDLSKVETRYVRLVNDHGNVTMFSLGADGLVELWSAV